MFAHVLSMIALAVKSKPNIRIVDIGAKFGQMGSIMDDLGVVNYTGVRPDYADYDIAYWNSNR